MTSFMVLDGVTSYLRLKDVTNTCKHVGHSPTILAGIIQCNGRKLEEAEDFKCVLVVCCVLESKKNSCSV